MNDDNWPEVTVRQFIVEAIVFLLAVIALIGILFLTAGAEA